MSKVLWISINGTFIYIIDSETLTSFVNLFIFSIKKNILHFYKVSVEVDILSVNAHILSVEVDIYSVEVNIFILTYFTIFKLILKNIFYPRF